MWGETHSYGAGNHELANRFALLILLQEPLGVVLSWHSQASNALRNHPYKLELEPHALISTDSSHRSSPMDWYYHVSHEFRNNNSNVGSWDIIIVDVPSLAMSSMPGTWPTWIWNDMVSGVDPGLLKQNLYKPCWWARNSNCWPTSAFTAITWWPEGFVICKIPETNLLVSSHTQELIKMSPPKKNRKSMWLGKKDLQTRIW